jgi:hypothetical protein
MLMPGYSAKAMIRFKHETPTKIQNSPQRHIEIKYGAKQQYDNDEEMLSPPLNEEETKYVQAVAGTLLYYARAVDSTILPALSPHATKQEKPTHKKIEKVKQLLDYCATQDEAIITYSASKMILCIHSNAGYCNKKNTCSQAGRHFYPIEQRLIPPQQRCHFNKCNNNKSGHILSS